MDPRGIFWTGARAGRSGASWVVPLALIAFWVVVTAFTIWELTTVGPSLSGLAAPARPVCTDQRDVVALRPKPLLL
jgi:hypothetical protein